MLTKLCSFYTILDFYNLLCSGYAWILPSFHDVFYKIFCLDWLASTNNELSVGRGIEKWSGGQLIKRITYLVVKDSRRCIPSVLFSAVLVNLCINFICTATVLLLLCIGEIANFFRGKVFIFFEQVLRSFNN